MLRYTHGIVREIRTYAAQMPNKPMQSVYFGGGTPSRLPLGQLALILKNLEDSFGLEADCEISLEANPEDVSKPWIRRIRELGVTRLSLGIQSFSDRCLKAVKRNHTRAQAEAAWASCAPFRHGRSIDLLLGLPHQTRDVLDHDLDRIADWQPDHVSVYMLDRDMPTPLDKVAFTAIDDDSLADWYEHLSDRLQELGFQHYEISNYAQPGYACRHNEHYWNCGEYLGIGQAAHGRIGRTYYKNHGRFSAYLEAVDTTGCGKNDVEFWSDARLRSEQLIQGLRTARGIPKAWAPHLPDRLNFPQAIDLFIPHESHWRLSRQGWLLSNEIFVHLL